MRGFSILKATLGMSLIEVTIALVVMGIVGISLLNLFVNGSTSAAIARRDVIAVNLAQEKLEEIKALPYNAVDSTKPENRREPFPTVSGYTYRVDVDLNRDDTKTVTVAVYYQVGGEEREVTLTTDKLKR